MQNSIFPSVNAQKMQKIPRALEPSCLASSLKSSTTTQKGLSRKCSYKSRNIYQFKLGYTKSLRSFLIFNKTNEKWLKYRGLTTIETF